MRLPIPDVGCDHSREGEVCSNPFVYCEIHPHNPMKVMATKAVDGIHIIGKRFYVSDDDIIYLYYVTDVPDSILYLETVDHTIKCPCCGHIIGCSFISHESSSFYCVKCTYGYAIDGC